MTILTLIFILVGFLLGYFTLDAWHDSLVLKDKKHAVRAASINNPYNKKIEKDISLKYNKRWHLADAIIKGYVVAFLVWALVGWSWWILIFFELAFAIRWFWFDLNLNWFRGMLPFYTGTVAQSDQVTKKVPLQIGIKVAAILLGIGLIWWNYNSLPIN